MVRTPSRGRWTRRRAGREAGDRVAMEAVKVWKAGRNRIEIEI